MSVCDPRSKRFDSGVARGLVLSSRRAGSRPRDLHAPLRPSSRVEGV